MVKYEHSIPLIMGILNVTPDSFFSIGRYPNVERAVAYAKQMIDEGASIIDIGGEATNPSLSSLNLSIQEELKRVLPVIEALRSETSVLISIDTSRPEVMYAAVKAGANMINDVRALQVEGALQTAVELQLPVCLMHMQFIEGMLATSAKPIPIDADVVDWVYGFLQQRYDSCVKAGMKSENIILDPGFGGGNFGKSMQQNLRLMNQLDKFHTIGAPLLVGVSRKSFIGEVLNCDVNERLYGSISLAIMAAMKGAKIIRVHDVKATNHALSMYKAVLQESKE